MFLSNWILVVNHTLFASLVMTCWRQTFFQTEILGNYFSVRFFISLLSSFLLSTVRTKFSILFIVQHFYWYRSGPPYWSGTSYWWVAADLLLVCIMERTIFTSLANQCSWVKQRRLPLETKYAGLPLPKISKSIIYDNKRALFEDLDQLWQFATF